MSRESPAAGRSGEDRLAREIEHGRKIAGNAESVWFWESPAGRRRADRRAELFVEHGGLAPGRRALELGCGTGVFLERVARCGARSTAWTSRKTCSRRRGRASAGSPNVTLDRGNAEATPYPERHFDAVYGSSILHHLDLDAALAEAHRVLRPGGRVVFAEPNILNPQVLLMFRFGPLEGALRGVAGRDGLLAIPRAPGARARRLRRRLGRRRSTSCIPRSPRAGSSEASPRPARSSGYRSCARSPARC